MSRWNTKRPGARGGVRVVWLGALSAVLSVACFTETSSDDDDDSGAQGTGASTSAGVSATDGPADTTATATSMPSSATAADSTGAGSATGDDATGATSAGSDSTGNPAFEPCPELIEPFDQCPGPPWMNNGSGSVACDGDAVLTVTAASDGNVQLVVPLGLVDATAVVDLVDAPGTGILTMLRVRTPQMQILAFRVNGTNAGPMLEAYVDNAGSTEVLASLEFDPDKHRWVRMRETGGQLAFEASGDGVLFDPFHEVVTPFDLTDATVGIAAGNYQALGADTPVSFGQFEYYCTGNPQ